MAWIFIIMILFCSLAHADEVVVSDTGTKYHVQTCPLVKKENQKVEKDQAVEQGYEPCRKCFKRNVDNWKCGLFDDNDHLLWSCELSYVKEVSPLGTVTEYYGCKEKTDKIGRWKCWEVGVEK